MLVELLTLGYLFFAAAHCVWLVYTTIDMKLCLAGLSFATKKHAKNHVRNIVDSLIGWEVHESSDYG